MAQASYAYACARISALSKRLLDTATVQRMAEGSYEDALRTSKDPDKDIAAALTAVQKDNGYMFDTAPTPPLLAAGTGSTTMIGGKDADTAMRKAMGLPTK